MKENKLKLNGDKTEFFIAASKNNQKRFTKVKLDVCGSTISPSDTVRNLGVVFDTKMTMSSHIIAVSRSLNFHLRNIYRIRRFIDNDICNHTARALITSRLDYSNSLLYGASAKDLRKLQLIQNRAAKLIFRAKRHDHVSPLLSKLHWLPVKQRITYKTMFLVYKCLNDLAPGYLKELLSTRNSTCTRKLRSSSDLTILTRNRTRTKIGDNAFANLAPKRWNALPKRIRHCKRIASFKSNLKTHLFPNN